MSFKECTSVTTDFSCCPSREDIDNINKALEIHGVHFDYFYRSDGSTKILFVLDSSYCLHDKEKSQFIKEV